MDLKAKQEIFSATFTGHLQSFWRVHSSDNATTLEKHTAAKVLELLEHEDPSLRRVASFLTPNEVQEQAYNNALQSVGGVDPFKTE